MNAIERRRRFQQIYGRLPLDDHELDCAQFREAWTAKPSSWEHAQRVVAFARMHWPHYWDLAMPVSLAFVIQEMGISEQRASELLHQIGQAIRTHTPGRNRRTVVRMGKVHANIGPRIREFIEQQPVFFVATAPLDPGGHVNVSPKGLAKTFAVIDENTVAYLDLTASGAETIAHLRENGRITVMFASFERTPNIVRLYGTGRVITIYDHEFPQWVGHFEPNEAARAVIVVDVHRVSDSCGYSLPLMSLDDERDLLTPNMHRRGAGGIVEYRRQKNRTSIDGLPAFTDDPA